MQFSLIPFISSFALTVIFLPLFIGFMRMKHEGQVIRDEGPKWHEKKSGTPTMGGVVFMLASVISTLWVLIWQKNLNKTTWILIIAFLGYGIILLVLAVLLAFSTGVVSPAAIFLDLLACYAW